MKITKILAILLAIVMTISLVACADPAEPDPPPAPPPAPAPDPDPDPDPGPDIGPIVDEEITLTVMQWALDNQTTDFENLWYYEQLAAASNINIDWIIVKESEWDEAMNLMFASLDWPDVIIRPNQSLNIEEFGVTQGILQPLDDYLEHFMPNYYSRMYMNNAADVMRASDGNMYYLGYLVAQNINHDAHYFINQTWLDAVDKEIPTTIDELTDVLKAFRDQNPGADGMYPMSAGGGLDHHIEGIYTYFGMFGVPLQRFVYASINDANQVVFPGFMDGFREACEWLAMAYAEGLLDPDALTQEENEWNAKINADQVGFQTYLRLLASAWNNPETIENWVSIVPPASSRGATLPRILEVPEFGAVLTVANQYIPETLQWLDAQFETEWMMVATNGPTVMTDEVRELLGEDGQDEAPLVFEDGKWRVRYVPDNQALYKIVPINQGQFFAPGDYYFDIFELPPHRIERRDYASKYQQAGVLETNSFHILSRLVKPSPDEASELQRLSDDIEMLMKERISNFILGGVSDADWDTFVSEAENVGVNRYIEIYQQLYDAWLSVQ
ncbi:MAG: sugar ABC transporter substrate-binding protein [Oscillospiraceae bacterium]|jgi:putative aldouronate transport system substrate-binding protein|nr:sugar ABC transporter substrate-binding protein [Oscillospiraceae bacterium]